MKTKISRVVEVLGGMCMKKYVFSLCLLELIMLPFAYYFLSRYFVFSLRPFFFIPGRCQGNLS